MVLEIIVSGTGSNFQLSLITMAWQHFIQGGQLSENLVGEFNIVRDLSAS